MDGGHGTPRSRDAVAALHEAARALHDEAYRQPQSYALGPELHWLAAAKHVRALADAPDPLAEAREIVGRIGKVTVLVHGHPNDFLAIARADHDALRRALGMEDSDHE